MIGTQRFQQGSLFRMKNKTTPDTWSLRYYEDVDGKRVYRKRKIGTVLELPRKADAERAVLALRAQINTGVRSPETVSDLIAHYLKHELTTPRKSYATVETSRGYINRWVLPHWSHRKLSEVKTIAVEQWLGSLPLAPASRTKIRNIMSAIYNHGIRHEWIVFNPISKVRCSSKRLKEPVLITAGELQALLADLDPLTKAIVMLDASTGLRRSELIALRWSDISFASMEIAVTRSCVRNHFGPVKTASSGKPVPLHEPVKAVLLEWRRLSIFNQDEDFLFPSERLNGTKPRSPDTLLKKHIRPALARAGITGKSIGYHSFRHSLASNLRAMGEDVKVAQELLRHANSRVTMDFYTQAVAANKREASARVLEMMLGTRLKGDEGSEPFSTLELSATSS